MRKTKLLALILSVVMLVLCFAGCGKSANYGTIDGKPINAELYNAMARTTLSAYTSYGYDATQLKDLLAQKSGEGDATMGDMMKESFLDNIKQYIAIEALAKDHDIALSDDDKKYLEEQKASYVEQSGGKAEFVKTLNEQGMTEEIFDYVQANGRLQEKVFLALFSQGGIYETDKNFVISDIVSNNVRVRHIVIQAKESDADFAEKKAKAEEALGRAKAGEDFEALIKEYGEDPGMDTYVDGYVFNKEGILADSGSPLDATFTETSFGIGVNEVSDICLSTSGLHIIKRLPLDEAYVSENLDTYYLSYASSAFSDKLFEIAEKFEVKTTEEFDNLDLSTLLDSGSAASTTHTADDGHDHE